MTFALMSSVYMPRRIPSSLGSHYHQLADVSAQWGSKPLPFPKELHYRKALAGATPVEIRLPLRELQFSSFPGAFDEQVDFVAVYKGH